MANTGKGSGYLPRASLMNVGSYQVSGHPYVTGSAINANEEHVIRFPYITKSITVINTDSNGADLRLHFNPGVGQRPEGKSKYYDVTGSARHYITLREQGGAYTFNVRCRELYISNTAADGGEYEVMAELTNIHYSQMYELSGTGLTTKGPSVSTGSLPH